MSAPIDLARGDAFISAWLGACFTWNGRTRAEGVDCYGLAIAFAREVLGKELTDWRRADQSRAFVLELMTREAAPRARLAAPRDGCAVIVGSARRAHHLGIFWRGRVLHADERRGVILERLAEFARAYPAHEFAELAP